MSMYKRAVGLFSFISFLFAFTACRKEVQSINRDYKTLGTSANDLLSPGAYSSLTIEINYMPGYLPDITVLNDLTSFLSTYLNKPGGVQILQNQIVASGKTALTLKEIVDLEKAKRMT